MSYQLHPSLPAMWIDGEPPREDNLDEEFLLDKLREQLQAHLPHGHKRFLPMLLEEAQLHNDKNHDYAKGGDPLGNFRRVGLILAQYPGLDASNPAVVALTYMLKQVDAVLWGLANRTEHKVEGYHGRLQDISVYAKLTDIIIAEDKDAQAAG